MKRVYSSHNRILLHHSRNLLEAEGVKTEVRNEFLSSAMGELPPLECQPELWVLRDEDAARAESILFTGRNRASGPRWQCMDCHEESEDQFTQCWRCGAFRTM
jgi:hypothetical protein